MKQLYKVETETPDGWVECWAIKGKLLRFAMKRHAGAAIQDVLRESKKDFAAGRTDEVLKREHLRITPCNELLV